MEKEKKYFKGIFIGFLLIVVMLFGVVINIGKTYSADTTPNCLSKGNVEYVWTTSALSSSNGACCPKGGSGYDSVRKVCTAIATKKSDCTTESASCYSCPNGYTLYGDSQTGYSCTSSLGEVDNSVCYYCDGRYVWSETEPTLTCNSSWEIKKDITKESDCKNTVSSYEVTFNTDGGNLYLNNTIQSRNVFSLSTINYASYTAKKEGYTFKGWTTTKTNDCSGAYTTGSSNVLEKKTLYACYYKEVTPTYLYKVYLNASSKDGINGVVYENNKSSNEKELTVSSVEENTYFKLKPYTAKIDGYTFKGWSTSSSCSSLVTTYKITSDKRFYACYSKDEEKENDTVYRVTFVPNNGTWTDGKTGNKVKEYTNRKYFTDSDITITRTGYTFKGWRSSKGGDLYSFIDSADDGATLTAIWIKNTSGSSSESGGESSSEEEYYCEYITKESCENYYDGYSCVEDSHGCFIQDAKKDDNQEKCEFESKEICENINEGFNCKKDSNGCYIKSSKINNDSSISDSVDEPISNPQTGTSLLYLAIIMATATLTYTIYYVFKLRKEN